MLFLWSHISMRLPLWTAQAHLPEKKSAIDILTEEDPGVDRMAIDSRIAPKRKEKKAA
jgi:hypothetical protein